MLDIDSNNFLDLFANSSTTGKLINFAITDFGEKIKKARISFGNVPLGIYRQGMKKKRAPIFHDEEKEKEIYQLVANLGQKGSFSASFRNFQQKITMNFAAEDFEKGLYFTTFTFNNFQTKMLFSFSPWIKKGKKCSLKNREGSPCDGKHWYRTVAPATSSFLAEKKAAKKRLGRELEGVNDLFAQSIRLIQTNWKPTNFKWVAVPELHKCQTPCHWLGKKHRKSSWKDHGEKNCFCRESHKCHRNWHIHMLSTDYLPPHYVHQQCGLGKYDDQGNPQGCWDHQAYIVHDIWPYGLVDIKRVSHLKVGDEPIKSAEIVVLYLVKYLAKSFQMRANKELAEKVGLLPGMSIFKFFRITYGHYGKLIYPNEKAKKPHTYSHVFINSGYHYSEKAENDFIRYFTDDLRLKKNAKKLLSSDLSLDKRKEETPFFWQEKENWQVADILKMCLRFSSKSTVKRNHYWKPCDTSEDPIWKEGQGWKVHCPITKEHHLETVIRWEFEFEGEVAYNDFKAFVLRALSSLNLPKFQKFQDYQLRQDDHEKFARQARLPWNREIKEYAPLEEIGENYDNKKWWKRIPLKLIYNYIYLAEIRDQIKNYSPNWEISTEEAMARYADY